MNRAIVEQRLRFLQVDEGTIDSLRHIRAVLEPAIDNMLDELYTHLFEEPELREIFQSQASWERARAGQRNHWLDILFSGDLGLRHFEEAKQIGRTHEKYGVTLGWYMGTYCFMLDHLIDLLMQKHQDDPQHMSKLIQALTKVVFLDMDFVIDSYLEAKDEAIRKVLHNSQAVFRELQLHDETLVQESRALGAKAQDVMSGVDDAHQQMLVLKAQMEEMESVLNAIEEDNGLLSQLKMQLEEMSRQLNKIAEATQRTQHEAKVLKDAGGRLAQQMTTINQKKKTARNTYSLHAEDSMGKGLLGRIGQWMGKLV